MSRKRDFYHSLSEASAGARETLAELIEQQEAAELWARLNAPPRLLVSIEHADHVEVRELVLDELVYRGPLPVYGPKRIFVDCASPAGGSRLIE